MKEFNMKALVLLLTYALFASSVTYAEPFNPYKHPIYKKYNKLDKKGGFDAVFESLQSQDKPMSKKDASDAFLVWLRDMSLKPGKDLRYGFTYASELKKIYENLSGRGVNIPGRIQGTASIAYFGSFLRLNNAISRCKDTTAGMNARMAWAPKNSDYKKLFSTLNKKEREKNAEAIIIGAKRTTSIEPISWVCADGINAFSNAIQNGEKVRKVNTPPGRLGESYEIDTSKHIAFISNDEWGNKKEENAKVLKNYLLSEK